MIISSLRGCLNISNECGKKTSKATRIEINVKISDIEIEMISTSNPSIIVD